MATTTNLSITTLETGQAQKEATLNSGAALLDAAIAGKLDIVTTGGTTTLTGTPTAPQAQNMFLNISGTLTSNATIEIPVAAGTGRNRLYIVKNGTSGNFSVTIKKVGGTGVEITQGITSFVMYDGSDIVFVLGGPWASWSPTWTNLTVGNGTVTGKFAKIGKIISCRLAIVFGSTTSVSGDIIFSLPVTRATNAGTASLTPQGQARAFDTSATSVALGDVLNLTTTTSAIRFQSASGSFVVQALGSSTVPFTWATGDEIAAQFCYEAA
jgi:hypothetical protein